LGTLLDDHALLLGGKWVVMRDVHNHERLGA